MTGGRSKEKRNTSSHISCMLWSDLQEKRPIKCCIVIKHSPLTQCPAQKRSVCMDYHCNYSKRLLSLAINEVQPGCNSGEPLLVPDELHSVPTSVNIPGLAIYWHYALLETWRAGSLSQKGLTVHVRQKSSWVFCGAWAWTALQDFGTRIWVLEIPHI